MTQLWLKYRPDTLADMVGCEGLKKDAGSWSVAGSLRCGGVIFAGPPGTGKSASARAIAKDMLGDSFFSNFHEFNTSDDRTIAFVRDRLKPLAEQTAVGSKFKIIFCDEADGLTKDSQDALKSVIEKTSPHTLWILCCNTVGRIIPALRSRLPTYTFDPLSVDDASGFLSHVCEQEGFPAKWKDSIGSLITKNRGDLRGCLKTMQVADPDDEDSLADMLSFNMEVMDDIYLSLVGEDYEDALKHSDTVISKGVGREEMIEGLHLAIIDRYNDTDISHQKALHHLLILGQWAARSPLWYASNLLFLQSMIGDFQKRG